MLVVYVLIPLMLVILVALGWTWWLGRVARDPVSSIDSFHRALEAMQPQSGRVRAPQAAWEHARPGDRTHGRDGEIVRASR